MNLTQTRFTIVELVVVVAIIALMVSLVLPVVSESREKAGTTSCSANLKQLGASNLIYADENDGHFMDVATVSEDLTNFTYPYSLPPDPIGFSDWSYHVATGYWRSAKFDRYLGQPGFYSARVGHTFSLTQLIEGEMPSTAVPRERELTPGMDLPMTAGYWKPLADSGVTKEFSESWACPTAMQHFTSASSSNYQYVAQGMQDNMNHAARIAIANDYERNHKMQSVNVAYMDGHVDSLIK